MPFDQDNYARGEWRSALDEDLYKRLGFSSPQEATEKAIEEAYQKRHKWWQNKYELMRSGSNPPIIRDVGPHIDQALRKLSEAKQVLGDPGKRRSYDDQLNSQMEGKWVEEIGNMLDIAIIDGWLARKSRDNVLQHCKKRGIPDVKASSLIEAEIRRRGAVLVDEPTTAPGPGTDRTGITDNYYEILGVDESATQQEIETAYKRLHRSYINDRNKARASARFNLVTEAHKTLCNPVKRRQYDQELKLRRGRGTTAEGAEQDIPGIPSLELTMEDSSKPPVLFKQKLKLGNSDTTPVVKAKNGGGGALDVRVDTNAPWLEVVDCQSGSVLKSIEQARLPQRFFIRVATARDKSIKYGAKRTGKVQFYDQKSGNRLRETLTVDLEVETEKERVRQGAIYSLTFGALFFLIIAYLLSDNIYQQYINAFGIVDYTESFVPVLSASLITTSIWFGFQVGQLKPGCILNIVAILGFITLLTFVFMIPLGAEIPLELYLPTFGLPMFLGIIPLPLSVYLVRQFSTTYPAQAILLAFTVPLALLFITWLALFTLPWGNF